MRWLFSNRLCIEEVVINAKQSWAIIKEKEEEWAKMKKEFKKKSDNLSMSSNSCDSHETFKYEHKNATDEEHGLEGID